MSDSQKSSKFNNEKNVREYNYELLRVVSMIAVIFIHISATYMNGYTAYVAEGRDISEFMHPVMACIYNTMSRFAVPCFVMISGTFLLDSNIVNYRDFYEKTFIKLGIPTIFFSVLYIIYRILICIVSGELTGEKLISFMGDFLSGKPFYHMWYMYMLIGLYFLTPVVILFKERITYNNFKKLSLIFFILASFSSWTTQKIMLSWSLGRTFEYLGYFMIGYVIRKELQQNKNIIKGTICFLLAGFILFITALVQYKYQVANGIIESDLKLQIVSPYAPTIVIASLLIFMGITMLEIKKCKVLERLAGISFGVYLFHVGVWEIICKGIHFIGGSNYIIDNLNCLYWIPLFVLLVFGISVVLTIGYNKVELYVRKRYFEKI